MRILRETMAQEKVVLKTSEAERVDVAINRRLHVKGPYIFIHYRNSIDSVHLLQKKTESNQKPIPLH